MLVWDLTTSSIQLGPKRKRPRSLQTKLKHSKEDRLIQSSKVSIRRVGKQVRTFLTLKIIQKIKTLRTAIENDTGDPDENEECKVARKKRNDKRHRQITNAEGKLKLTKEFDIEILVDRCLEDLKFNDHINSESEETKNKVSDDASKEDAVLQSFLMHKKIVSVVQSIKEKKSDFEERKHYRLDAKGNKIDKTKKHQVSFVDQIKLGSPIAEIKEVESFKEYNMLTEEDEIPSGKSSIECSIF